MDEPITAAGCTHERGRTFTEPDKKGQQVAYCIDCGADMGIGAPATAPNGDQDRVTDTAALVYSTSTPSACGIDGCQCCPPGETFCECHDRYDGGSDAMDEVYQAGRANQWWYRCDRGRGVWGPFKTVEHARFRQDEHRRLHVLSVEDERREVAAR